MFSISRNLITVLPFLWKEKTKKHKYSVVLAAVFVFLTIALNLSTPIIFKDIVNSFSGYSDKHYIYILLLLISYSICWTSGRFFEKIREMVFFKPLSTAISDYSLAVFKHIHSLSLKFHLDRETGQVAGAIQGSQMAIALVVTNIIFRILPVFIESLLAFFILWHIVGIQIGSIVIAILIGYLIMNYFIMGIFKKADKIYEDMNMIVDKRIIDSLLNSESIKYLGAEDFESSIADKILIKRENAIVKVFWTGTFTTTLQALLLGTGLTIISYIVGGDVLSGKLEIGDFVLVNGYLLLLLNQLEAITGFIRNTISWSATLEHSTSLLGESHSIQDITGAADIKIKNAEIKFKNISFNYDDKHRNILKDFNLSIPEKATVAIVGSSGSGKSTISRLIFRFYDVTSGSITIDNQDIAKITKQSLRKHISIVPQDIVLLNKSLKYNISYGNFGASDSQINKVIKDVNLEQLISKLPDGLETIVGERGVKLSGGEKQRVAIARALLKNPKILIFDEATSSVDTNTERKIQANIKLATQNITTILIAHRLSTVIYADKIVVLDKGIIAEHGTHKELLAKNGLYSKLWGEQHDKK